ncbi:hypothetical protein DFH08DRAFT_816322 [Mycena albidolilacea]|uniref:Uncharacterized protein n=1 Tax=Mycena albidolilacea TaxID=1033008 RepID=A0AAD7EHW3_9AGAR|nr:hypothetical protein DFH08DRAFT_816322 [Mycena albidolilacea]
MEQGDSTQRKNEMRVEDKPPNITIYFSSDPKKRKEDVEAQAATATGTRTTWIDEEGEEWQRLCSAPPPSEPAPSRAAQRRRRVLELESKHRLQDAAETRPRHSSSPTCIPYPHLNSDPNL